MTDKAHTEALMALMHRRMEEIAADLLFGEGSTNSGGLADVLRPDPPKPVPLDIKVGFNRHERRAQAKARRK